MNNTHGYVLRHRAPRYLADYCMPVSEVSGRQHLRSARNHHLTVPRARRSTFEDPSIFCRRTNSLEFTAWLKLTGGREFQTFIMLLVKKRAVAEQLLLACWCIFCVGVLMLLTMCRRQKVVMFHNNCLKHNFVTPYLTGFTLLPNCSHTAWWLTICPRLLRSRESNLSIAHPTP